MAFNNQAFSEVLNSSIGYKIGKLCFNITLLYLFINLVYNKIHIYNNFDIKYKILIYVLVALFCSLFSLWIFKPDYLVYESYSLYKEKDEFFKNSVLILFILLIIIPLIISTLKFLKNRKKIWYKAMDIVCICYIIWKAIILIGIFISLCTVPLKQRITEIGLGIEIWHRVIIVILFTLLYTSLMIFIRLLFIKLYDLLKQKKPVFLIDFILKGIKKPTSDKIAIIVDETTKDSIQQHKKNIFKYILKRKKNTTLLTLSIPILKITLHYLLYPERNGPQSLFASRGYVPYQRWSIGRHIDVVFYRELWLFIPTIIIILLIVWFFNDKIKAR
jgi:hypothetical protein